MLTWSPQQYRQTRISMVTFTICGARGNLCTPNGPPQCCLRHSLQAVDYDVDNTKFTENTGLQVSLLFV
jgi:hypothetical protein